MARKEDDSNIGGYFLLICLGFLLGFVVFAFALAASDTEQIQHSTLNNICKTIAGNNTEFKVVDTEEISGKQVIVCTKISPQKVFDDGSIILKGDKNER